MALPHSSFKLGFYRQCRLWHGYLSAFAFAALLFFAATGVVLNHPNWFAQVELRRPPVRLKLTAAQLRELHDAPAPARMLTKIIGQQTPLYGEYQAGETEVNQIFVRLGGPSGASVIRANLRDGSIVVVSERATIIGVLNALHRGGQAGTAWRALIDVAGGVLIVVSLVGYTIFFSMSTRLTTALLITGATVLGMVMLCVVAVR
jgi:uncharacterized protein